jgi:hypothetical protein
MWVSGFVKDITPDEVLGLNLRTINWSDKLWFYLQLLLLKIISVCNVFCTHSVIYVCVIGWCQSSVDFYCMTTHVLEMFLGRKFLSDSQRVSFEA